MKKLSGVTFDFDATLYSYPLMMTHLIGIFGKHVLLIYALTQARKKIREMGKVNVRKEQAKIISRKLKIPVYKAEKKIQSIVYEGWNTSFDNVRPYKGVFDVLDKLVRNNIPFSIVSDYPPEDKMKKMGFMKYPWKAIINCEENGLLKPSPEGFKIAMEAMHTLPNETLHVGDSLKYDIKGAKNAGMMSAWIKRGWKVPSRKIKPDYVFHSFPELEKLLEDEFGLK